MFERYTERARRTIFFARYEASSFGSPVIETEHLLLGMMRENKALLRSFSETPLSEETIREKVMERLKKLPAFSTSVDLPLSDESKRVLGHGAEEAMRLGHQSIGPEHLLLGLVREERCYAAEMLRASGLTMKGMRERMRILGAVASPPWEAAAAAVAAEVSSTRTRVSTSLEMTNEGMRVLTYAAEEAKVSGGEVGAGHLLMGLLREVGSPVSAMLRESGLTVEEVRLRMRGLDGPGR